MMGRGQASRRVVWKLMLYGMTFPRCFCLETNESVFAIWIGERARCSQSPGMMLMSVLSIFPLFYTVKVNCVYFLLENVEMQSRDPFQLLESGKTVNNIFLYRFSNLAKCRFYVFIATHSSSNSNGTTMTWERGIMLKKQKLNPIKISAMGRNGMKAMSVVWFDTVECRNTVSGGYLVLCEDMKLSWANKYLCKKHVDMRWSFFFFLNKQRHVS